MISEKLLNITKVIETSSMDEANGFLKMGWKLINTYTSTFSPETRDQVNMYVLGKPEPPADSQATIS